MKKRKNNLPTVLANPNVGTIPSRTSEVDYKQKYEQQKEEIHRLNSQVGGYKKNLNDAKDTIKALNADVNELKTEKGANEVFISQLENDLRINKDSIKSLTADINGLKGYLSELKAQIKERDVKINNLNQSINGLQLDFKQSNEDLSDQLDTTQRLAKKLQSIQSKWWFKLFS